MQAAMTPLAEKLMPDFKCPRMARRGLLVRVETPLEGSRVARRGLMRIKIDP